MPESKQRYHMPPEWAPHQGTWLSWPHNVETWPGCLADAEAALERAVVALAPGEVVHINVLDGDHEAALRRRFAATVAPDRVRFHRIVTDDAWCRDHGAIFVYDASGALVGLDFLFNAWGEKYLPYDADAAAARQMAGALGVPCVAIDRVLEGGSIEVNGAGCVLTTEQCLLNRNRNPQLGRADIEAMLDEYLGASQVVWLGDGIVGDDTDGHIDDLTRFVAESTVVTVVEPNRADVNHAPLAENLERLRGVRLRDGRALSIVELPMPAPVHGSRGRLPASYANFYIGNDVVIVPVFGVPQDARAIDALAQCFPTRRIVPIDARALVVGLGTFHCLTQQIPAARRTSR
ncbi:MAG TPA: agmatine deiminase family protein [Pseudomonadales bacterium]|nr:agmatine deiminase family protein [Pseudomonadales bacterium]